MRLRAAPASARVAAAGLALALALPAAAQTLLPQGPDFQVESLSFSDLSRPAVAMDADGDFVVVWGSDISLGTDTSDASIQARRFGSDGSPQGPQFQVNSYTTGYQGNVAVGVGPDGRFVVAWRSESTSDPEGIVAQRFAADGSPQGTQFQVNTDTPYVQNGADVSIAADGRFIVVWHTASIGGGGSLGNVEGRRFAADGTPQGAQFQINTYTTDVQIGPSVSLAPDGGFVVSWMSYDFGSYDANVRAQRFAPNGTRQGPEFQVNSDTAGVAYGPTNVAVADDGDFFVTWSRYDSVSLTDIRARRFESDGTPDGPDFQVNAFTTGAQQDNSVSAGSAGEFFVVWGGPEVQGSLYTPDGLPAGDAFQVNTYTDGLEIAPRSPRPMATSPPPG